MKIDLDFDFDYLRLYFKLDDYQDDFYCSKNKFHSVLGFMCEMELIISNNDGFINDRYQFGFCFDNQLERMYFFWGTKTYDFALPLYLFVSKTKEYVDHFNWIKEAYVS